MLANNVIRINGYKNNKRTHVDIVVRMEKVEFKNSEGKQFSFEAPQKPFDIAKCGFENGLDAVTSYNYWNWVGEERMTETIL